MPYRTWRGKASFIPSGRQDAFVTEDLDLIFQSRKQLSEEQLQQFVTGMVEFGYKKEELPTVLRDYIEGV